MKNFKFKFWYESNSCWGWIENLEDLYEKYKLQTEPNYGGLENLDEFFTYSKNRPDSYKNLTDDDDYMNFGTRIEHTGNITLKEYLIEKKVLNDFLLYVEWKDKNEFNDFDNFLRNNKITKILDENK